MEQRQVSIMSLNAQIQDLVKAFRASFSPELNTLVETGAGEISAMPIVENALKVGDKAPDFTLRNHSGEMRSLHDYLTTGPLVLTFYRGLWCPYCNLQLNAYNKGLADIRALGANLVAISSEGPDGAAAIKESDLPQETKDTIISAPDFDVLHDANTAVAKQFGVAFVLPVSHQQLLNTFKVNIERANGDGTYAFADPATYIIGQDGVIAWAYIPNNYRKRAEVSEILKQLGRLANRKEDSVGA
jgi:peroxiredoxin